MGPHAGSGPHPSDPCSAGMGFTKENIVDCGGGLKSWAGTEGPPQWTCGFLLESLRPSKGVLLGLGVTPPCAGLGAQCSVFLAEVWVPVLPGEILTEWRPQPPRARVLPTAPQPSWCLREAEVPAVPLGRGGSEGLEQFRPLLGAWGGGPPWTARGGAFQSSPRGFSCHLLLPHGQGRPEDPCSP